MANTKELHTGQGSLWPTHHGLSPQSTAFKGRVQQGGHQGQQECVQRNKAPCMFAGFFHRVQNICICEEEYLTNTKEFCILQCAIDNSGIILILDRWENRISESLNNWATVSHLSGGRLGAGAQPWALLSTLSLHPALHIVHQKFGNSLCMTKFSSWLKPTLHLLSFHFMKLTIKKEVKSVRIASLPLPLSATLQQLPFHLSQNSK